MSVDDLRGLLERHARSALTTAIVGVPICRADQPVALLQAGPGDLPRCPSGAWPGIAVSDAPDELLRPASMRCECVVEPVPLLLR